MDRTLFVILLGMWAFSGKALGQPTMTIRDEEGGDLPPPVNRLYASKVQLFCQFPKLTLAGDFFFYKVTLRTQAPGGQWNEEVECQYRSSGEIPTTFLYDEKIWNISGSDIRCSNDGTSATFIFRVPFSDRVVYDCLVFDTVNPNNKADSNDVTVNMHTKPTTPKIQPDSLEVEEGKPMTFSCNSEGYPPPQLSMKLDDVIKKEAGAIGTPSPPSLTNVSIEWNAGVVTTEMHNKSLLCQVNRHLYSGRVETEKIVKVIHGPNSDQKGLIKTHNINSKESLVLNGFMEGYPPLEYSWSSNGNPVGGNNKLLTVDSSFYESFEVFPQNLTFKVTGKNPRTFKSADRIITVTVRENDDETPPSAGSNSPGIPGLEDWHIAIIVIAIVAVLVAVIVGVILQRKSANSAAMKSKAAQARRPSDERHDPKYQSSTASLHQDNAAHHSGYHENPTLPVEYRYSQGNVEQYAEVIDDMPRSRKPIALDDMEMFDGGNAGPPMFGEAPPAYGDMGQYREEPNYSTYSPNYDSAYGAAC